MSDLAIGNSPDLFHYGLSIGDFVLPAGMKKDTVKVTDTGALLTVQVHIPQVNEATTATPITHT